MTLFDFIPKKDWREEWVCEALNGNTDYTQFDYAKNSDIQYIADQLKRKKPRLAEDIELLINIRKTYNW